MTSSTNRVVLGVNAFSHDSGAALILDGRLVFAASEERFDRVKQSPAFPTGAIHAALRHSGLDARDIDLVAYPWRRDMARWRRALYFLRRFPRSLPFLFDKPATLPPRVSYLRQVAGLEGRLRETGIDAPVRYVEHHLAHAVQAHRFGPEDHAALITADGLGEWTSAATWVAGENGGSSEAGVTVPRAVRRRSYPHSLGKFYAAVTQHLGFQPDGGEGRTMGLAPYGRPARVAAMRELLRPDAERLFTLDLDCFRYPWGHTRMTGRAFSERFGSPRTPDGPIEARHEDLARAAQVALEEALLGVARQLREESGLAHLGLAGGTFLNCVLNSRLRAEAGFDSLFVFPAAGDGGAAAGAAALAAGLERDPLPHPYLGDEFDDAAIERALEGRPHRPVGDPAAAAAQALARGRIVGWFEGRMEFGPRALGARSILADARDPGVRDRINRTVKFREDFRPLAPAVLLEHAADWFDSVEPSPFMLRTFATRPERREAIPAVVHVDGSARVQTVGPDDGQPDFRRLLERFHDATGVPMLVNTSLNIRGQPIVRTPQQAIKLFEETALDDLVIGNRLLSR